MKYQRLHISLTFFFFLLLCFSCDRKPTPSQTPVNWISEDPLSIPYRIRQQKYEKGNLVWNNSFESGKNLIVDSTGVTYRIDGWQKTGDHVEWVNIEADSIYDISEAFDSIRAVKINRITANETDDTGEGVISDFIKVIPGNYQFSFYIRLYNIKPNRKRLGTRIFDAINIRLHFYDKNKIEISSKRYDPYRQVFIDNSFKGYAFSNFYQIDSLLWSKVIGKSCNIPCIDGDLPDDARYVKIFLGLKGSGTMWIDQVDFRYGSNNFSFLEKMGEIMDTTLLKQEIIIPQPKKVEKLASIPFFNSKTGTYTAPIICIPENPTDETMQATNLIKSKIEELFQNIIPEPVRSDRIRIVKQITNNDLNHCKLIFSIGKTNLFDRFRDILPLNEIINKEQGYFIYTTTDLNNIVFLYGNDPAGNYYAAATAIQLFDNKKFMFHNAQIIDYPDFLNRNVRIALYNPKDKLITEAYKQILLNKINGAFFTSADFHNSRQNVTYEKLMDFPDYHSVLSYSLFLEVETGLEDPSGYESISSPALLRKFLDIINEPNKLIISPAYGPDQEIIHINPTFKAMENYADLINTSADIANKEGISDCIICFPVWRNNHEMDLSNGRAETYLSEIKKLLDKNMQYLWNGSCWNGYHTSNAELVRIKSLLVTNPVWWDNSMSDAVETNMMENHPSKLSLYNIFRPFVNHEIRELSDNLDTTQVFINFLPQSEFDMIRLATVSDFLWNCNDYDPDMTLWKILHSRYGFACAKELVLYNNAYAALLRLSAELKDPVHQQRLIRKAIPLQEALEEHFIVIQEILGRDHQLVKELQLKSDNLNSEIPDTEPES